MGGLIVGLIFLGGSLGGGGLGVAVGMGELVFVSPRGIFSFFLEPS